MGCSRRSRVAGEEGAPSDAEDLADGRVAKVLAVSQVIDVAVKEAAGLTKWSDVSHRGVERAFATRTVNLGYV